MTIEQKIKRFEYLSSGYLELLGVASSIKGGVLNIKIGDEEMRTGKVKGADDVINKGLPQILGNAIQEFEKELTGYFFTVSK